MPPHVIVGVVLFYFRSLLVIRLVAVGCRFVEGTPLLIPFLVVLGAVLLAVADIFEDVTLYSAEVTCLHSCSVPLSLRLVLVAAADTIREHVLRGCLHLFEAEYRSSGYPERSCGHG